MEFLSWDNVKTYSIKERKHKVKIKDFAKITKAGNSFKEFYDNLPNILAVSRIRKLVKSIVEARQNSKPVILMMGAHVIKCGLSPLIIELIRKDIITSVALNGAGIIHDFEVAFMGETSEDVEENIKDGSFGMVEETATYINDAIKKGAGEEQGLGESVGKMIQLSDFKYKYLSILANCVENKVACSVHVAIGTDVIHQHPNFDGSATGKTAFKDFKVFVEQVSNLGGGVILNVGSAVILPEVFLKAINIARNLGYKVEDFTTANFDQYTQYRPYQNVLTRPLDKKSTGYNFIGHHEFMIPLLFLVLQEARDI